MKPYNLEIFDRQFNYRAHTLIDANTFKHQEDMLTIVDNTITLSKTDITIRENPSSGSTGDRTVGISDYVRITVGDNEFSGVVKKLEKEDDKLVITYTDFLSLFNHEVFTDPLEVAYTTIEYYIRDLLRASFINNSDISQNIPGLAISVKSTTLGTFDFMNTTKRKVVLNILNDVIYPAFNKYLVGCYISFNAANKSIQINIGSRNSSVAGTIDLNLPNIIDKNVLIRGTSNEINKLTIIEDSEDDNYPSYNYYLHTDFTYDTNGSTNRLLPVISDMELVNFDTLAESSYWIEKVGALTAVDLIEIDRPISDAEIADIKMGLAMYAPFIYSARITPNYNHYSTMVDTFVSWVLSQSPFYASLSNPYRFYECEVNPYDDLQEAGEGYYYYTVTYLTGGSNRGYDAITYKGSEGYDRHIYDTIPGTPGWHTSSPITGRLNAHCNYHAVIKQNIKIILYVNIYGNNNIPSVYELDVTIWNGLPRDEYVAGHDAYIQSNAYKNDIAAYKTAHLPDLLSDYAGSVFGTSKYKNLIELTARADDPMIAPLDIGFGWHMNLIHKGTSYHSILTGGTVLPNGLVKLTFGMIRLELTKILNMKGV